MTSCCQSSLLSFLLQNSDRVNLMVVPEKNQEVIIPTAITPLVIDHNLDKFPKLMVFDQQGRQVEVAYRYEGRDRIVLEPNVPFAGTVYLS